MGYISRWPLFANLISACLCLGFSATFHLWFAHSTTVGLWCAKLDYAGIIILIFGSTMPPIYYYFSCGPAIFWRNLFITLMAVCSSITFVVTLLPRFEKPESRKFRGLLFIMLGCCAASIMIVLFCFRDPVHIMEPDGMSYLGGALVYLFGAILYITRVPERCKPGHFNIFGHSHQLFHFCVLAACFIHY